MKKRENRMKGEGRKKIKKTEGKDALKAKNAPLLEKEITLKTKERRS